MSPRTFCVMSDHFNICSTTRTTSPKGPISFLVSVPSDGSRDQIDRDARVEQDIASL